MAGLLPDDVKIVGSHPLEDNFHTHLRELQKSLEDMEQAYDSGQDAASKVEQTPGPGIQGSGQGSPAVALEDMRKLTMRGMLSSLMASSAGQTLPSKAQPGMPVAADLLHLVQLIQWNDFDYRHYRPLSKLFIPRATDTDIWGTVFTLIQIVCRQTPPSSIDPSFEVTPVRHSSASLQRGEQTASLLRSRIFEEIKECTYRSVGGFFEKYFEGKEWSMRSTDIFNKMKSRHIDGKWKDFPDPATQRKVWEWISEFQTNHLSEAPGVYFQCKSKGEMTGVYMPGHVFRSSYENVPLADNSSRAHSQEAPKA